MKKQTWRTYAAAGALLLSAALFSFGFPGLMFRLQDEKLEGQVGQELAQKVVITDQPELTIVEKVRLAGRSSSYSMVLEKGRTYDQETIGERAGQELEELENRGILSEAGSKVEAYELSASFIMDVEGENSVILWEGQVYTDRGRMIELTLDDETGKILSLYCHEGNTADWDAGEELAYSWGEYLGCHVASVSVKETEEILDKKAAEQFDREVQRLTEKGMSKAEARARVSEDWGLSDPGFSAEACYGDESGQEMVYQLEYIPFFGGSLQMTAK